MIRFKGLNFSTGHIKIIKTQWIGWNDIRTWKKLKIVICSYVEWVNWLIKLDKYMFYITFYLLNNKKITNNHNIILTLEKIIGKKKDPLWDYLQIVLKYIRLAKWTFVIFTMCNIFDDKLK